MNRKKVFSLILLVIPLTLLGQTKSASFNAFISQFEKLNKEYKENYDNKLFAKTEEALKETLELLKNLKLTKEEKAEFDNNVIMIKTNIYYNLACTYSLLGKKDKAISALDSSIRLGYKDYRHVLTDEDFINIRKEKKFMNLLESIKQFDHLYILQKSNPYHKGNTTSLPKFTYQSNNASNLELVREYFKLDSVAGKGDELSKIMNILKFIHNSIRHNGSNYALCEFDAIDIYNYNKSTGKGVNCRHLAIALNEMYLSMGIYSRYITCMPKNLNDRDCHVINSVYSSQLKKWLWIDPTFNAYVQDDKGNLLSIEEVRERLIKNEPLVLNDDANWNNESKQTKEHYLDSYMAKNLYWFSCPDYSRFNPESRYRKVENKYIELVPPGFEKELSTKANNHQYITYNPQYFWQEPSGTK